MNLSLEANQLLDDILRFVYENDEFLVFGTKDHFTPEECRQGYNKAVIQDYLDRDDNSEMRTVRGDPEMAEILDKLTKDKYLRKHSLDQHGFSNIYFLTFEGRWFIQQGGYLSVAESNLRDLKRGLLLEKNQMELQKIQTEMIEVQAKMMTKQTTIQDRVHTLTGWIAFGTIIAAVYYIAQLADWLNQIIHQHPFLRK